MSKASEAGSIFSPFSLPDNCPDSLFWADKSCSSAYYFVVPPTRPGGLFVTSDQLKLNLALEDILNAVFLFHQDPEKKICPSMSMCAKNAKNTLRCYIPQLMSQTVSSARNAKALRSKKQFHQAIFG